MADAHTSSSTKPRDRIQQLSVLRRGLVHHTDAQYGTTNDPLFVMHVTIDGKVFQGVGPSKKRAKVLASERALAYLGEMDASEVQMPDVETPQADDHTADVFTGLLYSNFETPTASAADANLKLQFYQPESFDGLEDSDTYSIHEAFEGYIGCNSVAMMSEIRPDAQYDIMTASSSKKTTHFVTTIRVKGRSYCGEARSKKLSKGRAAAIALKDIYGIEFGTSEDGMPIYEGSAKVWESYKSHLEMDVDIQNTPIGVVNPVEQLNELFPEAEFVFPDADSKADGFFRAQYTIAGATYEGIGFSKKDAKANAATNTVEALEKSGELGKRKAEVDTKRKGRQEKQKPTEKSDTAKSKAKPEKAKKGEPSQHPVLKLQEIYPQATYTDLGETPLRNTAMRAYVATVVISNERFAGVGRSKKLAKAAAAEKALRELGFWTSEDEVAKRNRRSDVKPLSGVQGLRPGPSDDVPSLLGPQDVSQYGRPARGRISWSRDPHGRGRGIVAGYEQDWQGNVSGDPFASESKALDPMINELSLLVGQILQKNPNMGVTDVWNLLQQNPQYQSWQSSSIASSIQTDYYNFYDHYYGFEDQHEFYDQSANPSTGYPGNWYYSAPAGPSRGRGVNVRSWSRDTAARDSRGGKTGFHSSASHW